MFKKPADGVVFVDDKKESEFNSLEEDSWIKKSINKFIEDMKENVFAGEHVKKKLIPKKYLQDYGLDNIWRYQLPNGWRLIYSVVTPSKSEILAVIVEWMDHKNYERRFGY
ncbi:MAG: hypothetical protein ABEI74_04345 [Candidatus Pacearchaeota archaeon]